MGHKCILLFRLALACLFLFSIQGASAIPQGETTSEERGVTVETDESTEPEAELGYRRRHALVVGIDEYQDPAYPDLGYAVADARAVAKILVEEFGFEEGDIKLLLNEDAKQYTLNRALEEWSCEPNRIGSDDLFVFFFAGHGSIMDNLFYFITSEVTGLYQKDKLVKALYVNELQEKFKKLSALKQVVFIDACHSGSSVDVLAMRGSTEEKALAQLSRSSGIHVLASSESQQQSAEIQSLGHGVFTYVLLEALGGKADGAPSDSKVTLYEIKSYIDDQVPEISYRLIRHKQFPSTFSIGHDFPLVIY